MFCYTPAGRKRLCTSSINPMIEPAAAVTRAVFEVHRASTFILLQQHRARDKSNTRDSQCTRRNIRIVPVHANTRQKQNSEHAHIANPTTQSKCLGYTNDWAHSTTISVGGKSFGLLFELLTPETACSP